ncbi:MAG: hypothetical protein A2017_04090 [Lentisphaerae bacterium GWF2_44_16]|nr:MAG: hypothetical protein A2017_04090 [Lentisphaerae bacterium GWF2_44_16]
MNIKILLITIFFATALFCQSCRSVPEIHKAAQTGNEKKVIEMIKNDPDIVNSRDKWGCTPLMYAAGYAQVNIVKLFIDAGADIDSKGTKGNTVWMSVRGNIYYCKNLEEEIASLQKQKYPQANIDAFRKIHSPENQKKWEEILAILIEAKEKNK